jgi:hypothetical protein
MRNLKRDVFWRSALVFAGACGAALSPARAEGPDEGVIRPGLWSFEASTLLTGGRTGQQCVREDQIAEFLTGPKNRHYRCEYPKRVIGHGEALISGECVDKGARHRYTIHLRGRYTAESFSFSGSIHGTFFGIPIVVPAAITAHRLRSDCAEVNAH